MFLVSLPKKKSKNTAMQSEQNMQEPIKPPYQQEMDAIPPGTLVRAWNHGSRSPSRLGLRVLPPINAEVNPRRPYAVQTLNTGWTEYFDRIERVQEIIQPLREFNPQSPMSSPPTTEEEFVESLLKKLEHRAVNILTEALVPLLLEQKNELTELSERKSKEFREWVEKKIAEGAYDAPSEAPETLKQGLENDPVWNEIQPALQFCDSYNFHRLKNVLIQRQSKAGDNFREETLYRLSTRIMEVIAGDITLSVSMTGIELLLVFDTLCEVLFFESECTDGKSPTSDYVSKAIWQLLSFTEQSSRSV